MNEGLHHPEAEVRRVAIAALSGADASRSLADLYALLDDADWRVRREVALALARLPDPAPALAPLLDAVVHGDVARRNAAMEALRQIGGAASTAVLHHAERTQGPARRFLIEVLADVGNDPSVPFLAAALDDPDGNIPPAAAEALGRIRGPRASEVLHRALLHPDPVVRLAVLQALAMREEALEWESLEQLLADPICRRAALRAAASSPDPRALAAIAAGLSDPHAALSGEAAIAAALASHHGRREAVRHALLERSSTVRVLGHLCERGTSTEVRRAAIECLGLLGDPSTVGAVLRGTESLDTSAAADEALDHFGSDAVGAALEVTSRLGGSGVQALLRWALPRASGADQVPLVALAWHALDAGGTGAAPWDVVASLGDLGDATRLIHRVESSAAWTDPAEQTRAFVVLLARFPQLASVLAESAPPTTRLGLLIAEVAGSAGISVAIEPLREALTATDPMMRAAAVRALGAQKNEPAARDALEFALADEDPSVQAAAAEALGALGAGNEVLEQSLRASEPRVRRAAARALGRRATDVRRVLVPALDDPEPSVVLSALEGLGDQATVDDLSGLTTHPDPDVASEALVRLRGRDAAAAAVAAFAMVGHPAWSVRLEAVRCLEPRETSARVALAKRLTVERDEMVREAIETALAGSTVP